MTDAASQAELWRAAYPFQSRAADIGGFRMHYVDEGSGSPIVAVHGNPSWSFYWRSLISEMSRTHRVIAPDHIGMGLSDKPRRDEYPFTLERRIDDLTTFIDSLDLDEPVTLVVHDWGGAIGCGWAGRYPDRLANLVVTNTAAFGLPGAKRMPYLLAAARSRGAGEAAVLYGNAFLRGAVQIGTVKKMDPSTRQGFLAPYDSPRHRRAVLEFVKDIPLTSAHRSYEALSLVTDSLDRLVEIPTLILWGAKDFVFDDAFLDEWRRRFPNAEVHRFEHAGHFVLEDASEEMLRLLREFLTI